MEIAQKCLGKIDGSWMKEDCEKACEPKLPKAEKTKLMFHGSKRN